MCAAVMNGGSNHPVLFSPLSPTEIDDHDSNIGNSNGDSAITLELLRQALSRHSAAGRGSDTGTGTGSSTNTGKTKLRSRLEPTKQPESKSPAYRERARRAAITHFDCVAARSVSTAPPDPFVPPSREAGEEEKLPRTEWNVLNLYDRFGRHLDESRMCDVLGEGMINVTGCGSVIGFIVSIVQLAIYYVDTDTRAVCPELDRIALAMANLVSSGS